MKEVADAIAEEKITATSAEDLFSQLPTRTTRLMDVSGLHGTPLPGMELWEHAYCLKHQNEREAYITNFLSSALFEPTFCNP